MENDLEILFSSVQQAETDEERQQALLELQIAQMPEDLVSALWAASIPNWFNARILAALRPELAKHAQLLYEQLQELPFVEEFTGRGHNIHELARNVLLEKLWEDEREEFSLLSRRAVIFNKKFLRHAIIDRYRSYDQLKVFLRDELDVQLSSPSMEMRFSELRSTTERGFAPSELHGRTSMIGLTYLVSCVCAKG